MDIPNMDLSMSECFKLLDDEGDGETNTAEMRQNGRDEDQDEIEENSIQK